MSLDSGTLFWLRPILACEELDATEALLVLALANHVGADDRCFVGIRSLAEMARVSYPTARRRLQAMEQRGFIVRTARHREDGANSVYDYLLVRSRFGLPERPPDQSARGVERGPRASGDLGGPARLGERAEVPRDEPPPEVSTTHALFDDPQPAPQAVDDTFERFWAAFPCKRGKPAAGRAWVTAVKRAPAETIIAAAERYRDDPNRSDSFTKWPQGWLNDQRWNDPPLPSRVRPGGASLAPPTQNRDLVERFSL